MIIVLGKNGMLGRYIYDYMLKMYGSLNVRGLTRDDIDVNDLNNIRKILYDIISDKDTVINCIGVINKRSDISTKDMYIVNSIFPHILARICSEKGAFLIHPSTDCVFTGKKGMYHVTDTPDANDDYGLSKYIGEPNCSVIRCSIIGEELTRKTSLLEWCISNKGKTVNGYINHYWNGMTCLEYAKLVYRIIQENDYWNGVRHFGSTYGTYYTIRLSKYELLTCINEVYNLGMTIVPLETELVDRTLWGTFVKTDLTQQIKELAEYRFDS